MIALAAALVLSAAPAGAAPAPEGAPGAPSPSALPRTASAPSDPRAAVAAAHDAYRAGDFAAAAAGYEAVLAAGWESPTVHLNLGNARLRLGRRGPAVASYLRALRLDPADADARANLRLAREGAPGGPPGEAPLHPLARAADRAPPRGVAAALAVAWLLLWIAIGAWRRAPGRSRPVLVGAAVAAGLAAAVATALLVGAAAARRAAIAVVIAPAADLRDGPETALRPARTLPEATALRVVQVREAVLRVRTPEGGEGWVRREDVELL